MNRAASMLFAFLLFMLPGALCAAKTVTLAPGENYREGELEVICAPPGSDELLRLTECQIWDDFQQKCLFESTVYNAGPLRCEEKCQHWDSFSATCRFQTSCSFLKAQKMFAQTSCEIFDQFTNSCVKTRQDFIKVEAEEQRIKP
jgi:hypothetical protein